MIQRLKQLLRMEGHQVFTEQGYLNIVGLRSNNVAANQFDDELHVFFKNAKKWEHFMFPITTDPGTYWLENPMMKKGTAMLKTGQYINAYGIALHQGKYKALCQIHKPVTVHRDYDRDATLDFFNGYTESGMFGINIHRASINGTTREIDRYSAGCQVFANAQHFDQFMTLCEMHRSLHGNSFTYTLLDFRAKWRQYLRWTMYGLGITGAAALGLYLYRDVLNDKRQMEDILDFNFLHPSKTKRS